MLSTWMNTHRGEFNDGWAADELVWRVSAPVEGEWERDEQSWYRRRSVRRRVGRLRDTLRRLDEDADFWSEEWAKKDEEKRRGGKERKPVVVIDLDTD